MSRKMTRSGSPKAERRAEREIELAARQRAGAAGPPGINATARTSASHNAWGRLDALNLSVLVRQWGMDEYLLDLARKRRQGQWVV
jgi:hypothetical protein